MKVLECECCQSMVKFTIQCHCGMWLCAYCNVTRPNHTHWDIVQNLFHNNNNNIDNKSMPTPIKNV
jgi:hypothetical protein